MNRRVILVDFYWTRDKDPRVPLGHASILAKLQEQGDVDIRTLVVAVNQPDRDAAAICADIMKYAEGFAPDCVDVAFGAYVWGEELLQDVLHRLKTAGFMGRIVLGGPQISYNGVGLERLYPTVNAFIRGYGEEALAAFVKSPLREEIPGVHWAGTHDRVVQAEVGLLELPSPWLTGTIPLRGQRFIRWETQRGCPFSCTFCQHREPGARLKRHTLSVSRIEAEIDLFCESEVLEIAVLDPIFNLSPQAIPILRRFAKRGFKGRLSLQCRAESVTEEFLNVASQLNVCLEFGLQTIHLDEGRVIKRKNDIDKVHHVLLGTRERNIPHEVSVIFGLPLQTLASFEETLSWCLERRVPVIKAFPLLLLRGTELERERDKWGLRESGGEMPMVVESETFNRTEWRQMACLSEALRETEGNHPGDIMALKRRALQFQPDISRWVPESTQVAI